MAINDLSDEGSQGSLSALERALVPGLSVARGDSKGSIESEDFESSDSSCSASTETVTTNLDASNHSQAQTSRPGRQRSIRFNTKARIRKIPHHSSLTEQQIADMWISKEDYKSLRKDCAQRIKFLDKVKLKNINDAPFCVRGLLGHTSAARAKKNAYRDVMYDALAQAMDKELEENLDDALSEICKICSAPSVKTAHLQGLRDAKEAKRIHAKDSDMMAVKI